MKINMMKMIEENVKNRCDLREQDIIVSDSNGKDVSVHHREPAAFQNMDWDDITDTIHHMDSGLMTDQMRKTLREDKQLLLSIRYKLRRKQIILRPCYKGESFHAFRSEEFESKAANYMAQMKIYLLIETLNGQHPETRTQTYLVNIVTQIETTLDDLYQSKCLNNIQYTCMMLNRAEVRLNYLYFVPDIKEEDVFVRPILICHNGPTMGIAKHLAELLWAMFDRATHCQKFSQGADAVQALELYVQRNLLCPTTLFVTFTMDDFCTVFPHQEILEALQQFLHIHASSDEDFQQTGISIETILRLVRLVLDNQFFVYNNKLYRQTMGGASGSPLTMPLAYIYLYHWKLTFICKTLKNKQEIFGRHLDEAFLTWNGSKTDLHILFDMTTHQYHHPALKIPTSIESRVSFHDAYLSHYNGIHYTKIYHYPTINQTTSFNIPSFPIGSDLKCKRKALIRAARCCSNVHDFNHEQGRILQGLSNNSTEEYIQDFLIEFGSPSVPLSLTDPNDYNYLRRRIIEYQQQKRTLQKEQKLKEKNTFFCRYLEKFDATEIATLKQALDNVHKKCCEQWPEWNQMSFKLVPFRFTPLTFHDYLVEKRPPLRLLKLSKSDIAQTK